MGVRLLALALLAMPVWAQTASWIDVFADESQVLVGRTLQIRAVVHDASGNVLPHAVVTWSVNNAAATISAQGLITAKGLATIRVTARSGSVTGDGAIQCIPSKVEVSPGTASVEVGSKTKFAAVAYDADGNPVPGVNFTWSVTNLRQGGSSLGRIDNTGTLSATGEGGLWVWATYNYNETFPGLQQRWVAYSSILSSVPKTYSLKKLYSTLGQMKTSWKLRPKQSMLWSTDDGQLFFNASLGGLANGLLNWDNGKFSVVSGAGMPRFGRLSTATEFRSHSITGDGQILSYEETNINGNEIGYGNRTNMEPFVNNNVPLGETEATSGLFISRNSLASTGQKIVRAGFRFLNETVGYTGLFRGTWGANELLVSTKDRIAGFTAAFSIDADFGIAANGTAYYGLTSGSNRIFFKHDYTERTRLIGVGDAVGTSKVRSFIGGRTNAPATWFDEDGTVIVTVTLEDNTQWYVMIAPDGTKKTLRLSSSTGILWRSAKNGVLIYANPFGSKGNGIYLWQDATPTQLCLIGGKVVAQTVQDIESGTVDAAGRITLLVRGDINALIGVRMGSTPYALFRDGETVDVEMPVVLSTLIGGARVGPPHAQAGGNAGSIAKFSDGEWTTTPGIGERLFGNTMWFGGSHGNTYNMRKAPNGDVYFINGANIAKIGPDGSPQAVIPFPYRPDTTLTVNLPGQFDVNGNGDILFASSTNAGDNRLFIWQGGKFTQILVYSATAATASTIDGRIAQSFDQFALDADGRVLAQLRFRNFATPFLCVWDGSGWTTAATQGSTKLGSHTVTGFPTMLRVSGSRMISGMSVDGIATVLAEWQGGGWNLLVDNTTVMPNGQVANTIAAADVNTRGDVLFQFSNGVNSLVVLKDGVYRQVHNLFRPTDEGDYLLRINAMDFRDDGTVFILAVNQFDEVVLYEANPV